MKVNVRVAPGLPRLMNGKHEFEELLLFFHWSPAGRRSGIERRGLVPGSPSLSREWRPPYICFSADPHLAWRLSGRIHPEIPTWDLWMVYAHDVGRFEAILERYRNGAGHYIKEYRVYERIFKRDVHHLGTRAR